MRKYFVTGIILLLPLALTIALLAFSINLLTNPFVGIVRNLLQYFSLLETGFLFLSADQLQLYVSRIFILLFLFFFIVLIGALVRWVVVHYFIRWGEYLFHKIPFVGTIYKTTKEVIHRMFAETSDSFKQVVLVPFPNPECYTIGFVTKEEISQLNENQINENQKNPLLAVFVPTTPNPTSGFLMMFQKDDVIFLETTVEDAFKYIVSCGLIDTPFKKASL